MALDILLVEAHDAVFGALRGWLKAVVPSCEVTRTGTVEEAVEIATSDAPGLVVIRNEFTGSELAQAVQDLKAFTPAVPVVVLADDSYPWQRDEVMAAGASAYVSTSRISRELPAFLEDLAASDEVQ
jgi:DNA-binding NarL/FixJ family response regulator